ncbi:hypothetical protein AAP_03850 [Ascosphaera apis ARSEF 7405]|uniref:Uncharacterized protein n=1 Tax=Ascosphaera apis ARSEF 7405 TaxID=392613 RepID=A0A166NIW0_9EURO|nr:hypothetical protein AAP_03850 [Ascosphaera apis ARSEF 7405]
METQLNCLDEHPQTMKGSRRGYHSGGLKRTGRQLAFTDTRPDMSSANLNSSEFEVRSGTY